MKRFRIYAISILLVLSMLSGCKKQVEEEESSVVEVIAEERKEEESSVEESSFVETSEESSEESSEEIIQEEPAPFRAPLSGEVTEIDMTSHRPYVFMCNNIEVSMPHCGVSHSNMIMELMEESGITRFMVWFNDPAEVNKIGSIRSARQYNVDIAAGYNAFLVHCGGSNEAAYSIIAMGLEDLDAVYGDFGTFYRDESRQTYGIEHSMFAVGEKTIRAIEELKGYDSNHEEGFDGTYGMVFSDTAVEQCGEKAEHIQITYAGGKTTSFEYDAAKKAYIMYQYGSEYTDDGEGEIPFVNVIDMYVATWLQGDGVHLSMDFDEGGEGMYFTEGKGVKIKWYKSGQYDCFHFTLEDGTPLEFAPGRTFICVNQTGDRDYQGYCDYE